MSILEEDAKLLTLPAEDIDYTGWLEQLKSQFEVYSRRQRRMPVLRVIRIDHAW